MPAPAAPCGTKGAGTKADGNVIRLDPNARKLHRRRLKPRRHYGLIGLAVVTGLGVWQNFPPALASLPAMPLVSGAELVEAKFRPCGSAARINCIVDGDTFWLSGTKIRIADINTPETSSPQCAAEARLGRTAKLRLQSLLNSGPFELRRGMRDEDRYGRKLRTVHRNGQSLGATLVAEGLAHEWRGRRQSWCG